jgi:hypothetical protein
MTMVTAATSDQALLNGQPAASILADPADRPDHKAGDHNRERRDQEPAVRVDADMMVADQAGDDTNPPGSGTNRSYSPTPTRPGGSPLRILRRLGQRERLEPEVTPKTHQHPYDQRGVAVLHDTSIDIGHALYSSKGHTVRVVHGIYPGSHRAG